MVGPCKHDQSNRDTMYLRVSGRQNAEDKIYLFHKLIGQNASFFYGVTQSWHISWMRS